MLRVSKNHFNRPGHGFLHFGARDRVLGGRYLRVRDRAPRLRFALR